MRTLRSGCCDVTIVTHYAFVLYVTGFTSRSLAAATNLRRVCEERLGPDGYHLEVVDVLDDPDRALDVRIIATPTVVRSSPLPRRSVVGDLSDLEQVARALEFPLAPEEHPS